MSIDVTDWKMSNNMSEIRNEDFELNLTFSVWGLLHK